MQNITNKGIENPKGYRVRPVPKFITLYEIVDITGKSPDGLRFTSKTEADVHLNMLLTKAIKPKKESSTKSE